MNAKVIAVAMQKGGVGKTLTTASLGVGLAQAGKKVLLIDCDPQGSLGISLGYTKPKEHSFTLTTLFNKVINEEPIDPKEGILTHAEGVDLLPANKSLAGVELSLINVMSRETILQEALSHFKRQYDYILLDTSPSLGMLTINALSAANSVIIPTQSQFLSAKGLEEIFQSIAQVRKQINPKLAIDGVLITMVDNRTNFSKEISSLLREAYGAKIKVLDTDIPYSIRAAETTAEGKSIFIHDPKGKVAEAYRNLTKEVLKIEKQRQKARAGLSR